MSNSLCICKSQSSAEASNCCIYPTENAPLTFVGVFENKSNMKAIHFGVHPVFSSVNEIINYTILITIVFVVTLVCTLLLLCVEISEYPKYTNKHFY